jgi:hypothetical protein
LVMGSNEPGNIAFFIVSLFQDNLFQHTMDLK